MATTRELKLRIARHGEERAAIYARMCERDRHRAFFYGEEEPRLESWMAFTHPLRAWCGVLELDGEDGGMFVVNGFTGKSALIHFSMYPGFDAYLPWMGRYVLSWLFSAGGFESITGLTPAAFRHVLRAVRAMGFVEKIRIPGACCMASSGKTISGVFSIATPETHAAAVEAARQAVRA